MHYANIVNGANRSSSLSLTVPNISPSDRTDIIGQYASATAEDARAAVAAANDAAPAWRRTPPADRAAYLDRIAQTLGDRADDLGQLLAREEGKTLAEARAEVSRAAQIFRYYAAEPLRMAGAVLPGLRAGVEIDVQHRPVGVVSAITPWNFPIAIPAWKIAPAIAYGNTVVLKPAELVPGSAWTLIQIAHECGLPPGVLNLIMGSGEEVGEVLTTAPQVAAITFTGSESVGRHVSKRAVAAGKRIQLEMGGKNPLVVLDDADLNTAVECAIQGSFYSTGQRCTASSRLIITAGIHDRFVEEVLDRMSRLQVGHALYPETDIGPVVDQRQLDDNLKHIAGARTEGATIAHGGNLLDRPTDGFFLEPALLVESTNTMRINREETFGPIASVIRADDYEHAVAMANDTPFGLSAGIVTKSLQHARRFRHDSDAGMVMVNLPTAGTDHHVPFGGSKNSSYGPPEQGTSARDFYTQTTTGYTRWET